MKGGDDRDRAIEHLLRQSRRAGSGDADSESCLDAEVLAAWLDGGLDDRALAMTEAHVSSCSRCQAFVGTTMRSMPEAALPEAQSRAPWWNPSSWSAGWLVPLTAATAAVALWMVVPGQGPGQLSTQPNRPQVREEEAPRPSDRALDDRSPARSADASTREGARAASPPANQPRGFAKEERAATGAPEANERIDPAQARPVAPAAPPPSESTPERSQEADSARRADEKSATADRVANAAEPARAPAAPAPSALGSLTQAVTMARSTPAVEVASPDPEIRWRLRPGGIVEHSIDSGSTWQAQSTGVATDLTAGSSPAPTVCWLVGRGGVVLITTDGRRWQRVAFPETVDLASVQAADARTASVTTTDGRTYRTTDAGQTWTR